MIASYIKNRDSIATDATTVESLNWKKPHILIGGICLAAIEEDAVRCFAASDTPLAMASLERGRRLIDEAPVRHPDLPGRDFVSLDRIKVALADRVERVLRPAPLADASRVPFEAFERYLTGGKESRLEDDNACKILRALFAIFEERPDEYAAALSKKGRTHRDFREEMALLPELGRLANDRADEGWNRYESVMARWLNPILETDSDASLFQDELRGLLVLNWAKYRVGKLDRETVLSLYFGEGLGVPMAVE